MLKLERVIIFLTFITMNGLDMECYKKFVYFKIKKTCFRNVSMMR